MREVGLPPNQDLYWMDSLSTPSENRAERQMVSDEGTTMYSAPRFVSRLKSNHPTQCDGPLISLGSSSAVNVSQAGGGGEGGEGGGVGGGGEGGGEGGAGGRGGEEGGGCGAKHMERLNDCSTP